MRSNGLPYTSSESHHLPAPDSEMSDWSVVVQGTVPAGSRNTDRHIGTLFFTLQ